MASANGDPRRFAHPERYDIFRSDLQHLTFGYGLHHCLGANLARLEGRVALDELLNRWPEWDVDDDGIRLATTSTVRGWERMPIAVRQPVAAVRFRARGARGRGGTGGRVPGLLAGLAASAGAALA